MNFGNFRKNMVEIGKDRKLKKASDAFHPDPCYLKSNVQHKPTCFSLLRKSIPVLLIV